MDGVQFCEKRAEDEAQSPDRIVDEKMPKTFTIAISRKTIEKKKFISKETLIFVSLDSRFRGNDGQTSQRQYRPPIRNAGRAKGIFLTSESLIRAHSSGNGCPLVSGPSQAKTIPKINVTDIAAPAQRIGSSVLWKTYAVRSPKPAGPVAAAKRAIL